MGFFEVFAGALAGFYALVPSYGVAIILLTVLVRSLLLPLSIKQTRSMREMQRIQPEVKKLQAKHKGDRQKLNEELMALYREHGVNPLGGCLPLLMQIPVFIGLFYVIRTPLQYLGFATTNGTAPSDFAPDNVSGVMETLQSSRLATDLVNQAIPTHEFLGIRLDCSVGTALSGKVTSLEAACGHGFVAALPYILLVLVMGFTMYYQQRQMQSTTASPEQAQQMRLMGRIMPAVFMFIGVNFPAGLLVYWITTNIWTVGQQYLMLHVAPPHVPAGSAEQAAGGRRDKIAAPAAKTGKKPEVKRAADGKPLAKRSPAARKKKR